MNKIIRQIIACTLTMAGCIFISYMGISFMLNTFEQDKCITAKAISIASALVLSTMSIKFIWEMDLDDV